MSDLEDRGSQFYRLGEVAKIQSGYAFSSSDWQQAGIPVVKIANLKDGRITRDGLSHVSIETAERASEFRLNPGDILLGMTGYVGEVARVRPWDVPLLLNQRVGRCTVTRDDLLSGDFLYFLLRSPQLRREFEDVAHGTAQPNLSVADFNRLEVPLPSLAEQSVILSLLNPLDERAALLAKSYATSRELLDTLTESLMFGLRD